MHFVSPLSTKGSHFLTGLSCYSNASSERPVIGPDSLPHSKKRSSSSSSSSSSTTTTTKWFILQINNDSTTGIEQANILMAFVKHAVTCRGSVITHQTCAAIVERWLAGGTELLTEDEM